MKRGLRRSDLAVAIIADLVNVRPTQVGPNVGGRPKDELEQPGISGVSEVGARWAGAV